MRLGKARQQKVVQLAHTVRAFRKQMDGSVEPAPTQSRSPAHAKVPSVFRVGLSASLAQSNPPGGILQVYLLGESESCHIDRLVLY